MKQIIIGLIFLTFSTLQACPSGDCEDKDCEHTKSGVRHSHDEGHDETHDQFRLKAEPHPKEAKLVNKTADGASEIKDEPLKE